MSGREPRKFGTWWLVATVVGALTVFVIVLLDLFWS